jgi:hypothetical protein
MAFHDRDPGPSWPLRAGAAVVVLLVLGVLVQLLFGVF